MGATHHLKLKAENDNKQAKHTIHRDNDLICEQCSAKQLDNKLWMAIGSTVRLSVNNGSQFYMIDCRDDEQSERGSDEPCVYAMTIKGTETSFNFDELIEAHEENRLILRGEHTITI
ncbi:hypothetical protein AB4254_11085 [Vibrio breoganii]